MVMDPRKALEEMRGKESTPPVEKLPATTTIKIDVTGSRGERYQHEFRYTVPNLGQQIEIGKLKTLYLPQGSAADPNAALLVEQIAYLSVTLDQKSLPSWWDPMNLYDAAPIGALYREALFYERRFHGQPVQVTPAEGPSGVAEEEGQELRGDDGTPEALVGDGAQPAPQRRKTIISSSG